MKTFWKLPKKNQHKIYEDPFDICVMLPCCCSLWMQKFSPLFGIQMKKLIPNNIFTYHVKNVVKSCTESVYLRVFIVHYFLAWWRKKLFFFLLSLARSLPVYCKYAHRSETLSASHHVRGFSWQTRKRKSNIIIVSAHMLNETSSSPFTIRSEKKEEILYLFDVILLVLLLLLLLLFEKWCCCC